MPSWTIRITGLILAILSCCTPELLSAAQQPASVPSEAQSQAQASQPADAQPATAQPSDSNPTQSLPDAPGTTAQTSAAQAPNEAQTSDGQTQQSNNGQNQQTTEPAGTAAAQIGKLKGGPASKPAGAAIAPAKQRRVRSYLLKFGALAGAGAAIGTVYALSHGSPSRPPGAH